MLGRYLDLQGGGIALVRDKTLGRNVGAVGAHKMSPGALILAFVWPS